MGSFNMEIPPRGHPGDRFSNMPSGIKAFIRDGFSVLAKVPPTKMGDLFQVVLGSIEYGSVVDESEAQAKLGITKDDARPLLAAVSLVASTLSSKDETADELIEELAKAGALDPVNRPAALKFAFEVVAKRTVVHQTFERSQLASRVLPSLDDFEATVDVRLGFDKNRIAFSVPVALVHIDTDARGQELWLQLSKRQIQKIIGDLQDTLEKMSVAEAWLKANKEGS
jgi:hypothetical protein